MDAIRSPVCPSTEMAANMPGTASAKQSPRATSRHAPSAQYFSTNSGVSRLSGRATSSSLVFIFVLPFPITLRHHSLLAHRPIKTACARAVTPVTYTVGHSKFKDNCKLVTAKSSKTPRDNYARLRNMPDKTGEVMHRRVVPFPPRHKLGTCLIH